MIKLQQEAEIEFKILMMDGSAILSSFMNGEFFAIVKWVDWVIKSEKFIELYPETVFAQELKLKIILTKRMYDFYHKKEEK